MAKTDLALAVTVAACLLVVRCGRADGQPPSASPLATEALTRAGAAPAVVVKRDNPCWVLLPSEVSEILGVTTSMREVVDESTCHFVYDKPSPEPAPLRAHGPFHRRQGGADGCPGGGHGVLG